jgi:DNA-directed RNA polymerase specialized sigma24 family protein
VSSGGGRPVTYDDLIGLWQDGQRGLSAAEPADRAAMDRVVNELVAQLRRRLGGPFTVNELARLYVEQGTDWCFDVAVRVAPNRPAAWDLTTVAGSAFAIYARQAIDYTTGRRTAESQ